MPSSPITKLPNQQGWVLILPGIMNVKFHLAWFRRMVTRAHPSYRAEIRRWGWPFGWIANLRAYARNKQAADMIARDVAAYRRNHPEAPIHLVGYSGGGGLAVMVVDALPDGGSINRLLLVAPAISPQYPLTQRILPKVTDFVVNYASRRDRQIAQGTKIFGTMDGVKQSGAGALGFAEQHPRLIEVHWHKGMRRELHLGDHAAYLSPFWQRRYLLPALDPAITAESLRQLLI